MRNALTIQWGDKIKSNPMLERIGGIKTLEAAHKALSKRNKDNMTFAIWGGIFLVGTSKQKRQKVLPVNEEALKQVKEAAKPVTHAKQPLIKTFGKFVSKLFTRQKH